MVRDRTAALAGDRVGSRIFRRTTLPISLIGVLLLGAGVYGAWRVNRLQQRGVDILSDNVAAIHVAKEFQLAVQEWRLRLKRYVETEDSRQLAATVASVREAESLVDEMARLAKTSNERELVHRLQAGYGRFTATLGEMRDADGLDPDRLTRLADEVLPETLLALVAEYVDLNEQELTRRSRRNASTANQVTFGLLALGTCGGVAGLLAGYAIARRVSRTIVQLSVPIEDAAGKLSEAVGPVAVSADPGFDDLERVLQSVSSRVATVVERLQESEREMLRAEQLAAVGQLAAGLAHELRNPLTSVKAILQLADGPGDLTRRDLEILKQDVARLEGALDTFLDFARPSQPEKRIVDAAEIVAEAVESLARAAERRGHRITGDRRHGTFVVADAVQVRQLVLNLVLNAFEAMPESGDVRVDVFHEADEPGGDAAHEPRVAVIRVADSGRGLPDELGERIFEPFASTKETGVGLGLSICRRIVEAHDGELTAENRAEENRAEGGAVFTVRLPAIGDVVPSRVASPVPLPALSGPRS